MHDKAIASAIVTLGRTMGMAVVAEGMERVEQANYFISQGCRLMQGFVFARPAPAAAFAGLLRDGIEMPAGLCAFDTLAPASARAGLSPPTGC
jgi:EAL domain-containing protein (putative c-di-GMP-specific phosphodiesterase class I)